MAEDDIDGGLCESLSRVASEPEQVDALYAILGEFCHVIRNQLNSLNMGLYLACRDGCEGGRTPLEEIEARYRELERLVERIQTICRPMRLVPMSASLDLLMKERQPRWAERLRQRELSLILEPPEDPTIARFDPMLLGQGLDAVVNWRAQVAEAGGTARIAWGARDGQVELRWIEATADPHIADVAADDAGSSLALPLLVRILSAHGGTLHVARDNGLELRMRWSPDPPTA